MAGNPEAIPCSRGVDGLPGISARIPIRARNWGARLRNQIFLRNIRNMKIARWPIRNVVTFRPNRTPIPTFAHEGSVFVGELNSGTQHPKTRHIPGVWIPSSIYLPASCVQRQHSAGFGGGHAGRRQSPIRRQSFDEIIPILTTNSRRPNSGSRTPSRIRP